MTPRPAALLLAAAFAASARTARADNAQMAAAAAAQAMSQQNGGAAAAAAGVTAPVSGKQGGIGRGFSRQLSTPVILKTTDSPEKSAPAKKGARSKSNASKYKSRDLTENSERVYRFSADGEPVIVGSKKNTAAKPSKKASSDSGAEDEKRGACSSDEPCAARDSDANAL